MKTFVTAVLLSILSIVCHAQIDFQPGYYIRNDGTKISCLIKDFGWRNNPKDIVCKTSADAAPVTIGQENIIEFGVGNAKYQRFEIDVDVSRQEVEDISKSPLPEYRHETAMLKMLVEGKASLYVYRKKDLTRFYFKLNTATPQPLVYKQYLNENGAIAANRGYIGQLFDSLSCAASNLPDPATLRYEEKGFVHYFTAYNSCAKSVYTDYWTKTGKTSIHLNIRPGIDLASLTMTDDSYGEVKYPYGTKTSFRIGAEAEMVLPFNRNKWALTLEPEYRSYTSGSSSGGPGYKVDYKSIQALLGVRYFMFVGSQSKLYLGGAIFTNFKLNSTIEYEGLDLVIEPRFGASVGAGFRYGDRLGIEINYSVPQQILDNYEYLKANLSATSVIISCRIL